MSTSQPFDFWYAVNNTEVVIPPRRQLETFGATTLYYHLVAEHMDAVNQIRVREGRIHAYRPQIITPESLGQILLEGFSESQARQYMDWIREHEAGLVFLKYGFSIRKEQLNEHIITDSMENVIERVRSDVEKSSEPMHALIRGVDEPWEVCLLKLMVDVIQRSAPSHARELKQDPDGIRHRIEDLFRLAARDASMLGQLSRELEKAQLFAEYEERFFALVKAGHRG